MPVKDCQTEKLILDTAAKIFFADGWIDATTQDIADAAGLSRPLIHYYFRSKKALINAVVRTTMMEFKSNGDKILTSDVPFREKTEMFIDDFLRNQARYPFLEAFVTTRRIRVGSERKVKKAHKEKLSPALKAYSREIENEMNAGTIPKSNPLHFLMNMFSLMAYPVLMKQMYTGLLNIDEAEYSQILGERKEVIINILFPDAVESNV